LLKRKFVANHAAHTKLVLQIGPEQNRTILTHHIDATVQDKLKYFFSKMHFNYTKYTKMYFS